MIDRRNLLAAAAIASTAWDTTSPAFADQPAASGAARLNTFGPEADRLALRAGLWDVVETIWAHPTAPPKVTSGLIAERFMLGSALQELLRPPQDVRHQAVARTDVLNYNRMEGRWSYVSFDTRVPVGLMPAWSDDRGSAEEVRLSFVPFAFPGDGGTLPGTMLRMEQNIRYAEPDQDSKDQFLMLADGTATRWLAHRYEYRRRRA